MYPTALWILDVWVLTGVAIGMLATIYGAFRSQWHILAGIREFFDWFFFVILAIGYLVILFWTQWSMFNIWSLVAILVGYGLWVWLAAPLVFPGLAFLVYVQARGFYYFTWPMRTGIHWIQRSVARLLTEKNPPPNE